jgi:hypothetical protein
LIGKGGWPANHPRKKITRLPAAMKSDLFKPIPAHNVNVFRQNSSKNNIDTQWPDCRRHHLAADGFFML